MCCLHSIPAIKNVILKKTDAKCWGRLVQDIPSPCGLDPTGTLNGHQTALTYSTCWVAARNADWNEQTKQQFRDEVSAIVAETAAHPSIIGYVVSSRDLLFAALLAAVPMQDSLPCSLSYSAYLCLQT